MIICSECGNAAPSRDGFCSSCGALLEWAGERVTPAPGGTPAPTDSIASGPAAGVAPGLTPGSASGPTPGFVPGLASGLTPGPAPGFTPGPTIAPIPVSPTAASAAQASGPLTVPPAAAPVPTTPAIPGPTPSFGLPGATTRRGTDRPWSPGEQAPAHQPAAEANRPGPEPLQLGTDYSGDYCWSCGTRNPEGRTFCRSCGERLSRGAAPAPRPGWWRRLMNRLFGRRTKTKAAGERPANFRKHESLGPSGAPSTVKPRKRLRLRRRLPLSRVAPLLAILGLIGIGIGPARVWVTTHFFNAAQHVQQRLHEQYVTDAPTSASASSAEKGHAAGLAIDGVDNTYWSANDKKGDGVGDTLTITFATPVDLARLGVLNGQPGAAYLSEPRPKTITLSAPGDKPQTVSLVDSADFQNYTVSLKNVSTLTITVTAVYPGQKGHELAITELEFFSLQ